MINFIKTWYKNRVEAIGKMTEERSDVFIPEVYEDITFNGKLGSIPINKHRHTGNFIKITRTIRIGFFETKTQSRQMKFLAINALGSCPEFIKYQINETFKGTIFYINKEEVQNV